MGQLTPGQRAYIRKRTKFHEPGPDELDDELNIVPFLDIVINLIMFLLMLLTTVGFYTQVSAELPSYARGGIASSDTNEVLNLSLFIVDEGLVLTGSSGKVAPGCETTQTGEVITVPMTAPGQYDWDGLRECATRLHNRFEDETQITVSADNLIPFQHVISAIDATREDGEGNLLFPDVRLSAGVR